MQTRRKANYVPKKSAAYEKWRNVQAALHPKLWSNWTTDEKGHTQHNHPPLQGHVVLHRVKINICMHEFFLPSLIIRVSEQGVTVLANENIAINSIVTRYLGRIRSRSDAAHSPKEAATHFRAISKDSDVLDSRCDEDFPLGWYISLHALGGFIDDPWFEEQKFPTNCKYESYSSRSMPAYAIEHYPYENNIIYHAVLIRATKDIQAGERLFIDYGTLYHDTYGQ